MREKILEEIKILTEAAKVISNPFLLEDRIVNLTEKLNIMDKTYFSEEKK